MSVPGVTPSGTNRSTKWISTAPSTHSMCERFSFGAWLGTALALPEIEHGEDAEVAGRRGGDRVVGAVAGGQAGDQEDGAQEKEGDRLRSLIDMSPCVY